MSGLFEALFGCKDITTELDEWFVITPIDCPGAFSCAVDSCPMMLSKTGNRFLRDNFDIADFTITMKPMGFYQEVASIKFRNEEDAVAFKLRWL